MPPRKSYSKNSKKKKEKKVVPLPEFQNPGSGLYDYARHQFGMTLYRLPGLSAQQRLAAAPASAQGRVLVHRVPTDGRSRRGERYFYMNVNVRPNMSLAEVGDRIMGDIVGKREQAKKKKHDRVKYKVKERMQREAAKEDRAKPSDADIEKEVRYELQRQKRWGNKSSNFEPYLDDEDYNYEIVRFGIDSFGAKRGGISERALKNKPEYRFFNDIEEEIKEGDEDEEDDDYDDEDDDDDDIEGDIIGSHYYYYVPLEQFSIKPLIMRDFTCIYESLMIIKWFEENERQPPVISLNDWRMYVLIHFNSEPFDVQQMFYGYWVVDCLKYFLEKYKIDVKLFNAHTYQNEMIRLRKLHEELGDEGLPYYFLVYWGEHVFPCTLPNLELVYKYQDELMENFKPKEDRIFMIVPQILSYLNLEAKLAALTGDTETYDLHIKLQGFSMADIFFAGDYKQMRKFSAVAQRAVTERINDYRELQHELKQDYLSSMLERDANKQIRIMDNYLRVMQEKQALIYYTYEELALYNGYMERREYFAKEYGMSQGELQAIDEKVAEQAQHRILAHVLARRKKFLTRGLAVIDLETYMDDNPDRETVYNMVPFCATLYGRLQYMYTQKSEYLDKNGNKVYKSEQRVRLVHGINKVFMGFHPKECVRKLIRYLMDNNYCYVLNDYQQLKPEGGGWTKYKQLYNYIFAHNGFGFDFKFMFEDLNSMMREFTIVGDITQTKYIKGNGLFLFDFSLIYREKLKDLAKTFFPKNEELWKYDCDLVIDLQKETLKGWYDEAREQGIPVTQQPQIKMIVEYCQQDSRVLFEIVSQFFLKAYTTPFGYSFLPKMFYHSLSAMAYNIFTTCYLTKPIFVNKEALVIEQETKRGGCTGANSNFFGIGVFIDENSFYPAIMYNEMPVQYESTEDNPYEIFEYPVRVTREENFELIRSINIYRTIFKFPEGTVLPTISQRSQDTLVMVLYSNNYDKYKTHEDAEAVYLFGYELLVAFEEVPGFECYLFGQIRYKEGDFIFKQFIIDYYEARLKCKAMGDPVGDKFHKNIMNSSQGKLGQKLYDNVKFGGITYIRDMYRQLEVQEHVTDIKVKYILTDYVDLFELRWSTVNDYWMSQGCTVRLPSYIMAVARSYLMRIYNLLARVYGSQDVIAYYDTDSVLVRFDLLNAELDREVQQIFDEYLQIENEEEKRARGKELIQQIGEMINATQTMRTLHEVKIRDVTRLHEKVEEPLLHETKLGACKIEKYVIRGVALGAKQYGVYYMERNGRTREWELKVAVKLKGVRYDAVNMDMMLEVDRKLREFNIAEVDTIDRVKLPMAISDIMTKWSRMGAGTMLSSMRKIIRPTLSKRDHNIEIGTSVPFLDIDSFQLAKDYYEEQAKKMKELYRDGIVELVEYIKSHPNYVALYNATRLQNELRRSTRIFFSESVKTLSESRKRYLLRLRKIKFDQLQDIVLELILYRSDVQQLASNYLPKLEAVCNQGVIYKRSQSKKSIYDMRDDKSKLSIMNSSRTIAYVLFIRYIMNTYEPHYQLPHNFNIICEHLSREFIKEAILGVKEKDESKSELEIGRGLPTKNIHRWNYALVYAFEFLQAGLCIYRNHKPEQFIEYTHTAEDAAPLSSRMEYTSLWRFMNNLQNQFLKVRNLEQGDVIDTRTFADMVQVEKTADGELLMRGPQYMHHLLISEIQNPDGSMSEYKYNLVNQTGDNLDNIEKIFKNKKRSNQQRGEEPDDDEIQGTFVPRTIMEKVRKYPKICFYEPISDSMDIYKEYEEDTDKKLAKLMFMSSMIHSNIDYVETIDTGSLFDLLRQHYNMAEFPDAFLQRMFCFSQGKTAVAKATKNDLYDLALLFLFLYTGKREAAIIMKTLYTEIKDKHEYSQNYAYMFVKLCRIVFCRPQMFQAFLQSNTLSKKTKRILVAFMDLTYNFDPVLHKTDEEYLSYLNTIVTDQSRVPDVLYGLVRFIRDSEQVRHLGRYLYDRIILWRRPTEEMIRILRAMLIVDKHQFGDTDQERNVLLVNEFARIHQPEQLVMKHMEEAQQYFRNPFPDQYHQSEFNFEDYNLFLDGGDYKMNRNNDEAQRLVMDAQDELYYDYAEKDYNAARYAFREMEAAFEEDEELLERYFVLGAKRVREADIGDDEIMPDDFGAYYKRFKSSRFFEMEAEESEAEEMICTMVHHGRNYPGCHCYR